MFSISAQIKVDQSDDFVFLLADGEIKYDGFEYWKSHAASDTFDIEWAMNYTTLETISVTSLSDKVVRFDKSYDNEIVDAYQLRNSIEYSPVKEGLRFLDANDNLLDTDNTTLDFSIQRDVNKTSGERIRALNPSGASAVGVTSYYDSSQVYAYTWMHIGLGAVGTISNVFEPNITKYEIGYQVSEYSVVTGEEKFGDVDVWVVENNDIPEGYSTYSYKLMYEKQSGLQVSLEFSGSVTNDFDWKWKSTLVSGLDVIDDGAPKVTAPSPIVTNSVDNYFLSFSVTENHFAEYNLYRNGTIYESGDGEKQKWEFLIIPTSGNTSWTLEIIDELGFSSNATTWIKYVPEVTEPTSLSTNGNDTGPQLNPLPFDFWFGIIGLIISIFIMKRKAYTRPNLKI